MFKKLQTTKVEFQKDAEIFSLSTNQIVALRLFIFWKASLKHHFKTPFSSTESLKKAKEYLEEYGVFDGHNDLPMTITYYNNTMNNDLSKVDLYKEDPLLAETTIPWIKAGKLRKVFKLILRALSLIGWNVFLFTSLRAPTSHHHFENLLKSSILVNLLELQSKL